MSNLKRPSVFPTIDGQPTKRVHCLRSLARARMVARGYVEHMIVFEKGGKYHLFVPLAPIVFEGML